MYCRENPKVRKAVGVNIDSPGASQTYMLIKLKKNKTTTSIFDTQSEGGLEE